MPTHPGNFSYSLNSKILFDVAPIKKDQQVGTLKVLYKGELLNEHKVYALEEIKKMNVFSRIIKSVNYLIWGDV